VCGGVGILSRHRPEAPVLGVASRWEMCYNRGVAVKEVALHLNDVIWKEKFVAKIADKHGVTTDEVEDVLFSKPHVRRAERGHVRGENQKKTR
jgi:hypothetical protein